MQRMLDVLRPVDGRDTPSQCQDTSFLLPVNLQIARDADGHTATALQCPQARPLGQALPLRWPVCEGPAHLAGLNVVGADFDRKCALADGVVERWGCQVCRCAVSHAETDEPGFGEDEG